MFETVVQMFSSFEAARGYNTADYLLAMNQALLGFKLLSISHQHDGLDDKTSESFGNHLFEYHDSAMGPKSLMYLWHLHFPSISSIHAGAWPEFQNLGVNTLPTYPLENPRSENSSVPQSIDYLYRIPVQTQICLDSGHNNEGLAANQRSNNSNSPGNFSVRPSSSEGSSRRSDSSTNIHESNSSAAAEFRTESVPDERSWPRKSLEYFVQTDQRPWLATNYTHIDDFADCMPETLLLPCRRYTGHCNFQTTKDVNFVFDRYVASGSDDGHVFIWDRDTMDIVQIIRGDNEVVNIIEGHPSLPLIAISGIDSEVHLFSLRQGGPSTTHRRNFPLVRDRYLSSIGVTDPLSRAALMEMVYAPDPYFKALCYSGHSSLPVQIDLDEVVNNIRREFPAVSESCMSNKDAIINENEDMRFAGLAHASLTRQIMTNITLGSMFSESSSEAGSGDEDEDEDEDEDDSEISAPFSIWEFGELENVEEYIDDHYSDQSSSSGDSSG
ncbi:hypothetical protein FB645_002997 [Coemansia sp. IMI 203386]|nr:hypothetical protein FB645_002997 [Coemansia sp. IMI 203386]